MNMKKFTGAAGSGGCCFKIRNFEKASNITCDLFDKSDSK
jgi:hypothetical protein